MGKERENSVPPEFITAAERFITISNRMDEAWMKMKKTNQYSRYQSMGARRTEELMSGKRPKKGEKYIAEYLRALNDLFSWGQKSP